MKVIPCPHCGKMTKAKNIVLIVAVSIIFATILHTVLTVQNKLVELYNNGKERCPEYNSTIDYCFYNGEMDNGCFCKNGLWFGNSVEPRGW